MAKGVLYVMTAAVSGLIKVGKTKTRNYQERMRQIESTGYHNVTGFKRLFAIEVDQYDEKEKLLKEIFSKHQVGGSEIFALDQDLVVQLLTSFDGKLIYPEKISKKVEFKEVTKTRKQSNLFSFHKKGLKKDDKIEFLKDKSIVARVVSDREVEYGGQIYKLSSLTRKIHQDKGKLNKSGSYQGAAYWRYNNQLLKDLPNLSENINTTRPINSFGQVSKKSPLFNFYKKGLSDGDQIQFIDQPEIVATVVGGRRVEYQGQSWRLSPLTAQIYKQMGRSNKSGAYQGSKYWRYRGQKLSDLPNIKN